MTAFSVVKIEFTNFLFIYFLFTYFFHFSLFQVRTSYLPNEILWGHQFDHNVLIYDKKMGSYQVHHSRVNKTLLDDTPRVSARQLAMRSKRNSSGLSNSTSTDHSPSKKPFKRTQSTTQSATQAWSRPLRCKITGWGGRTTMKWILKIIQELPKNI